MAYTPRSLPAIADPVLREWLQTELQNIAREGQAAVDGVLLDKLYAAPKRIREGLTVLADGTTWNPGSGAGVYTWYAGSWKKLG